MSHEFTLQQRKKGDIVILDLTGDLTVGVPEKKFRDTVADLIHNNQKNIIVNLAGIDFIDSSGIGAMVKSHTTLLRLEGRLKLLGPGKMARQTLKITGLLDVLEVWDDELEALASF